MTTDAQASTVAMGLIEIVLRSHRTDSMLSGLDSHMPALGLVGEMVPYTVDPDYITRIIAACLPADYSGNTLKEIPGMIRDSVKKGYAEPAAKGGKNNSAAALTAVQSEPLALFHTELKQAFASVGMPDGGSLCVPIKSEQFKNVVRLRYYRSNGKTLPKEALNEVLDLLEAKAIYEGPCEAVHVRTGGSLDTIYYDLGRPDGLVVKIDREGWRLVKDCPLRFFRPPDFLQQIDPVPGGDLKALARCLDLDDTSAVLVLAFLVNAFMPAGPYMILLAGGEQGSGKSVLCSVLRRVIDPNVLDRLTLPHNEHTLAILATQHRVLVFDNA